MVIIFTALVIIFKKRLYHHLLQVNIHLRKEGESGNDLKFKESLRTLECGFQC